MSEALNNSSWKELFTDLKRLVIEAFGTPWWISELSSMADEVRDRTILVKIKSQVHSISDLGVSYVFSEIGQVEEVAYLPVGSGFHSRVRFRSKYDSDWAYHYYNNRNLHQGCCELEIYRSNDIIRLNAQKIDEFKSVYGINDSPMVKNGDHLLEERMTDGKVLWLNEDGLTQDKGPAQVETKDEPITLKETSHPVAYQVFDKTPDPKKCYEQELLKETKASKECTDVDLNPIMNYLPLENSDGFETSSVVWTPKVDYVKIVAFDPGEHLLVNIVFWSPVHHTGEFYLGSVADFSENVAAHEAYVLEIDTHLAQNRLLKRELIDENRIDEFVIFDPGGSVYMPRNDLRLSRNEKFSYYIVHQLGEILVKISAFIMWLQMMLEQHSRGVEMMVFDPGGEVAVQIKQSIKVGDFEEALAPIKLFQEQWKSEAGNNALLYGSLAHSLALEFDVVDKDLKEKLKMKAYKETKLLTYIARGSIVQLWASMTNVNFKITATDNLHVVAYLTDLKASACCYLLD